MKYMKLPSLVPSQTDTNAADEKKGGVGERRGVLQYIILKEEGDRNFLAARSLGHSKRPRDLAADEKKGVLGERVEECCNKSFSEKKESGIFLTWPLEATAKISFRKTSISAKFIFFMVCERRREHPSTSSTFCRQLAFDAADEKNGGGCEREEEYCNKSFSEEERVGIFSPPAQLATRSDRELVFEKHQYLLNLFFSWLQMKKKGGDETKKRSVAINHSQRRRSPNFLAARSHGHSKPPRVLVFEKHQYLLNFFFLVCEWRESIHQRPQHFVANSPFMQQMKKRRCWREKRSVAINHSQRRRSPEFSKSPAHFATRSDREN
ncbi:hypothetical protein CEXT_798581 [Caerostris extrusa]|uniref:Uncharacterized protein n=1 Tax=Caerostris extrusa TaxID=172846 RepID=A0AAV4Q4G5_CAEEX|nr:hypothetical protein CEXT_798581 [Caerostris extrusa]